MKKSADKNGRHIPEGNNARIKTIANFLFQFFYGGKELTDYDKIENAKDLVDLATAYFSHKELDKLLVSNGLNDEQIAGLLMQIDLFEDFTAFHDINRARYGYEPDDPLGKYVFPKKIKANPTKKEKRSDRELSELIDSMSRGATLAHVNIRYRSNGRLHRFVWSIDQMNILYRFTEMLRSINHQLLTPKEWGWGTWHSKEINKVYGYLRNQMGATKTLSQIRLLTYEVFESVGALPRKKDKNSRVSFIRKHTKNQN